LSADDLLAPGTLNRAAEVLDKNPDVGLVHGWQVLLERELGSHAALDKPGPCAVQITPGINFIEECCSVGHNPVGTPTAVVRTTAQRAVGGYRKSLPLTADMEMWLRFAAHGNVAHIDTVQAFKRIHQTNMQHQYLTTALRELRERLAAFKSFFDNVGESLARFDGLRDTAKKSLAQQAFWAASRAFDQRDETLSRECLAFAVGLNPDLVGKPEWKRFQWKRRLGTHVWRFVRPVVDRLRFGGASAAIW
jgi:hypothetical protein